MIAWTTVAAIVGLLPGITFMLGFAAPERHAREIVRTSVVGDIAIALLVAILLHAMALWLLGMAGVALTPFAAAALGLAGQNPREALDPVTDRIPSATIYVIVITLVGMLLGYLVGRLIVAGPLRALATHRWAYDVLKFGRRSDGVVTAYVLTTIAEGGKILMYRGRLSEFYLNASREIAYLVLQSPARFVLGFEAAGTAATQARPIFDVAKDATGGREWNYLLLPGDGISNVSFDRSAPVAATGTGRAALSRALDAHRHE